MEFILIMGGMMLLFMFMTSRGNKRRMEQTKNMLDELEAGEYVITTTGFIGRFSGRSDGIIELEGPDGSLTEWVERAIAGTYTMPGDEDSDIENNTDTADSSVERKDAKDGDDDVPGLL